MQLGGWETVYRRACCNESPTFLHLLLSSQTCLPLVRVLSVVCAIPSRSLQGFCWAQGTVGVYEGSQVRFSGCGWEGTPNLLKWPQCDDRVLFYHCWMYFFLFSIFFLSFHSSFHFSFFLFYFSFFLIIYSSVWYRILGKCRSGHFVSLGLPPPFTFLSCFISRVSRLVKHGR